MIQGQEIVVIDGTITVILVGGQKNERRKWMHCFSNVSSILFVVAISEFDQTLEEDEKKNRFQEAFDLFGYILSCQHFQHTFICLLLVSMDSW